MVAAGELCAGLQPGAGCSGPCQEERVTAGAARPAAENRAPGWKEAADNEADGDASGWGSVPLARLEELGDRQERGPDPEHDLLPCAYQRMHRTIVVISSEMKQMGGIP
jgi:hypothetical protein